MGSLPLFQLRLAGYGLLLIGLINLLLRIGLSTEAIGSAGGRLSLAQGLAGFAPWLLLSLALIFVQGNRKRQQREVLPVQLLHRLLLPLALAYLLLIPLMVRDAIGFDRALKGQIESQVARFRNGSSRVQERVRSLTTAAEVIQELRRYPNLTVSAAPGDSAVGVRRRLAEALQVGEAQLRGRLEDLRRSRGEGLAQRTLQSSLVCLVAAGGLAVLRRQNLSLVHRSGQRLDRFYGLDLLPQPPRSGRRLRLPTPQAAAFPHAWLGVEDPEAQEAPGQGGGS